MIYAFEIDGTICSSGEDSGYHLVVPYPERIKRINVLYDGGHRIIFHSSRGMKETNNKIKLAKELFLELTKTQLKDWGVKYHQLIFGKPHADIHVDTKAMFDTSFFGWRG